MQVRVFGSNDERLGALLTAIGCQVTQAPAADLQRLASSTSAPPVIVIDVRGGAALPAGVAAMRRHHPEVAVLLVAPSLEPSLLLDAMRAGITEVITEPLTQDNVEEALARLAGRRSTADSGQVFVFVGAKGGVGTTTVAVNTAATLGRLSKPGRTLLMDLHQASGDAAVFVGAEPKFTMGDAVENIHRLDLNFFRGLVVPMTPNTDLLASPERMPAAPAPVPHIHRVVDFAVSAYRYVVIDLSRADLPAIDGLARVAGVFVVVNQELATLRSAARLLPLVRQRHGDVLRTVLTRADDNNAITLSDVEQALGTRIAERFPNDYPAALNALNIGRPLAIDSTTELATSFKRFAATLAGVHTKKTEPARTGLFARLSPRRV